MPLYDYRCPNGHTTEQIRKSDVTEIACPLCQATAERQLSRPGAVGRRRAAESPTCSVPGGCCGGMCET
jgi:putative FmdB family regulatory protein